MHILFVKKQIKMNEFSHASEIFVDKIYMHYSILRANLKKVITSPSNSIPRRLPSFLPLYCESQPHKGYYLTFKLNSMTVAVFPSLIFPFHFPPSPVYPTVFSICFFPGFIAIFILLSSNSNNNNSKCFCQLIVSIQASSFKNIS